VLSQDYIARRAPGRERSAVVWKHALKNAIRSSRSSGSAGTLLGGSVYRDDLRVAGVGRLSVQAIYNRDYPVVQAGYFSSRPFVSSPGRGRPLYLLDAIFGRFD